jgi:hypothetical protein
LSTTQPRWPRIRPPRTWKTWTAASSASSANAITSASVPSPSTTDWLLHRPAQRPDVVAQPGRPLELHLLGRGGHLPLQPADHGVGLPRHEVAEVVDDPPVLLASTRPTHGAEHLPM